MQAQDLSLYHRVSLFKAIVLFFVSPERYLDLAVNHSIWVSLKAPDLRGKFESGEYDPDLDAIRETERRRASDLRSRLLSSLLATVATASIAAIFAYMVGGIDFELGLDLRKVIAASGTFLVGWAALLELGTGLITWSGETLSELIHPKLFQVLFIPGLIGLFASSIS